MHRTTCSASPFGFSSCGAMRLSSYNTAELWKALSVRETSRANAADRVVLDPRATVSTYPPDEEEASPGAGALRLMRLTFI
jgi:hypothetical protein